MSETSGSPRRPEADVKNPPVMAGAFWSKVQYTPGCWLWLGALGRGGYGLSRHRGVLSVVHRVAYELLVGPIPEGLQLDHLCRVRHCVNPDHLEPVTALENVRRSRGWFNTPAHECARGHAGFRSGGNCVQCVRDSVAAHRGALNV